MERQRQDQNEVLRSVIHATRSYVGDDPLRPWLHGIKTIRRCLGPEMAMQKLPRFIEKCATTFISDERYRNDLRYLQVWIHLLDFVPMANRGEIFRGLEKNKIGQRHALFYQAYALHHEKSKNYTEAHNVYKLGIQRIAQPIQKLHQSYDSFLQRMAARNRRKLKIQLPSQNPDLLGKETSQFSVLTEHCDKVSSDGETERKVDDSVMDVSEQAMHTAKILGDADASLSKMLIVIPPSMRTHAEAENEVLPASEASEPVRETCHTENVTATSVGIVQASEQESQYFIDDHSSVYSEEIIENPNKADLQPSNVGKFVRNGLSRNLALENIGNHEVDNPKNCGRNTIIDCDSSYTSIHPDSVASSQKQLGDDTMIIRSFVGSAIIQANDDIEDALHHGLIEPTINTKEAMSDIIDMFGKPLDFMKSGKTGKPSRQTTQYFEGFQAAADAESRETCLLPRDLQIFTDENENSCIIEAAEDFPVKINMPSNFNSEDTVAIRKMVDRAIVSDNVEVEPAYHYGLLEPTMTTKEAMQDISNMFSKPLKYTKSKKKALTVNQPNHCSEIFSDQNPIQLNICSSSASGKIKETENMNPLQLHDFEVFVDDEFAEQSQNFSSAHSTAKDQVLHILPDGRFNKERSTAKCNSFEGIQASAEAKSREAASLTSDLQIFTDENENPCSEEAGQDLSMKFNMPSSFNSEDTVAIRKIVECEIISDSVEVEPAYHHGLVEPTMTTKEAMQDISNMFSRPLIFSKSRKKAQTVNESTHCTEIFPDEAPDELQPSGSVSDKMKITESLNLNLLQSQELEVFVDDEFVEGSQEELALARNTADGQDLDILPDDDFERENSTSKCNTFEKLDNSSMVRNYKNEGKFTSVKCKGNSGLKHKVESRGKLIKNKENEGDDCSLQIFVDTDTC